MRMFTRFIAVVALSAFFGLAVAETFHSHEALGKSEECSLCHIAHQAHGLAAIPKMPAPEQVTIPTFTTEIPRPYFLFVFASHGLSPPVL